MLWVSFGAPVNWWSLLRERYAGTWRWGNREREGGESALACWEQLEELGSGRGHDPAGTTVTHRWKFLQLLSGSFVYFIKQLQMLCCFFFYCCVFQLSRVALLPQCFMVRLSVLSKALMMTWNDSRSIMELRQRTRLKTRCSSLMFAPRRCYRVTFGTMGLFLSSSRTQ